MAKYKQTRKIRADTRHKIERQLARFDEGEDFASTKLAEFFHLDEKLAIKYFRLLDDLERGYKSATGDIAKIILGESAEKIDSQLKKIRFWTDDVVSTYGALSTDPLRRIDLEDRFDLEKVDRFLEANNLADMFEDHGEDHVSVQFAVHEAHGNLKVFQNYRDNSVFEYLNAFHSDVSQASRSLSPDIMRLFLVDYRAIVLDETNVKIQGIFMEDLKKLGATPGFLRVRARIEVISKLLSDPDLAIVLHELAMETLPWYQRLGKLKNKKQAASIFEMLHDDNPHKYVPPNTMVEKLEELQEAKVPLHLVYEMILDASENDRKELFDKLLENPALVQVYKKTRPSHGRSALSLVNEFILEYSNILVAETGQKAHEFISELLTKNVTAQLVPVILDYGMDWTQDMQILEVIAALQKVDAPDKRLGDYLNYKSSGDIRADVVLDIAKEGCSYKKYKLAKPGLDSATDEELQELRQRGMSKLIDELVSSQRLPSSEKVVSMKPRMAWQELMLKDYEPDEKEELVSFHNALKSEGLDNRLRYIWQQDPASVKKFMQDMGPISTKVRYVLLKDSELFQLYSEKLIAGEETHEKLSKASQDQDGNIYFMINSLFRDRQVMEVRHDDVADDKPDYIELPVPIRPYKRVVIYGGMYDNDAVRKIEEASSVSVKVIDYNRRKIDIPPVREDDLVLISTGHSSHSFSGKVVRMCKQVDVKPVYVTKRGTQVMINLIQQLVA
jgi:hypothetical protein